MILILVYRHRNLIFLCLRMLKYLTVAIVLFISYNKQIKNYILIKTQLKFHLDLILMLIISCSQTPVGPLCLLKTCFTVILFSLISISKLILNIPIVGDPRVNREKILFKHKWGHLTTRTFVWLFVQNYFSEDSIFTRI